METAPIVLFIYNRAEHTKKTLDALSKCILANESRLIVYADGPKADAVAEQRARIEAARQAVRSAAGTGAFKSVEINEASGNKGLAQSIIEGVTAAANKYGRVIVLEDDIICGLHFLEYMNSALERYKDEKRVWHITGFASPISCKDKTGSFFHPVPDCWGWGTWADRWAYFEKDTDKLISTFTAQMIHRFNFDDTCPNMWEQVMLNKSGKLNTWAIYWYAAVFLHDGLCLAPNYSLTRNIGFDATGINCSATHIYDIPTDINHEVTSFPKEMAIGKAEWEATKRFNKNAFIIAPRREEALRKAKKTARKVITFPYRAVRKACRITRDALYPDYTYGAVFMLHRVGDWNADALFPNENMKITSDTLQRVIDKMKKTHNIIPSTELHDYIKRKAYKEKPFCVFTMDDGYKDNCTEAYPVFKQSGVPFTIFLAASFPEQNAILWWYVLEDLLQGHDSLTLSDGSVYEARTKTQKEAAFMAIRSKILDIDQRDLLTGLNKMFAKYNADWRGKCAALCLNWEEAAALNGDQLCTIGAHTYHHYNLKALPAEGDALKEINDGIDALKAHGIEASVFAYPFGSPNEVGEREINVLSKMRFSNAFLSYGGEEKRHSYRRYAVRRIMLTEEYAKSLLR